MRADQDCEFRAHVAQLAEHVLGKDEVTRSIRVVGSIVRFVRLGLLSAAGEPEYTVRVLGKQCSEKRSESWRRRSLSDESPT